MNETVSVTRTIAVPGETVWSAISGIGGLDRWFSAIESCEVEGIGPGAVRVSELHGGGRLVDRVDEIDPEAWRFRYERTELPFPVSRYEATVLVRGVGDTESEVSWTVEIEVENEARAAVTELLESALSDGIGGLERDLR